MRNKEDRLLKEKVYEKLSPKLSLRTSRPEALEDELLGVLNKLEHRVGVLMTIAQHQRVSGCYESAEAYKKQALQSKGRAESIRKLLTGQTE